MAGSVALDQMIQQLEVRRREDDWTGVTSSAQRRKLQNRLHQRTYLIVSGKRRRAKQFGNLEQKTLLDVAQNRICSSELQQWTPILDQRFTNPFESDLTASTESHNNVDDEITISATNTLNVTRTTQSRSIHNLSEQELRGVMRSVEKSLYHDYSLGSPRVDQLLTLIQFNVLRALFDNAAFINCRTEWVDENAVSPWYSPSAILSTDSLHNSCPSFSSTLYPSALLPTSLQRITPHHPWIDLFPFPRMRDNLLRAIDMYDEVDLCNDLVDFRDVSHEQTGLIVWDVPWDPSGWEASSAFLAKWGWVVQGCEKLFESTNRWRRARGQSPLRVSSKFSSDHAAGGR